MKKLLVTSLLVASLVSPASSVEAKEIKTVKAEPDRISVKMLTTRKDKVQLVEVCKGKVTSQRKDGRILNTKSRYNYISYRGVKGCHKGDTVTTYIYFDTHCNYTDCISRRIDVVRCKHNHKVIKTDRVFADDICK